MFLIAIGNGKGSLICTGGEPAALLQGSRLVGEQIEMLNGEAEAAQFAAYPRTLAKLHGTDWIACGTAAMSFDPLSGEGTGAAVRESILAAATVRAILRGDDPNEVLAEFSLRMRLGLLRHLEMCRTFYQVESKDPFWSRELAMLDDGISWVRKEIGEQPAPRYKLLDFDLVRL
jgi:flavin-dependent dehydrogenase